MNEILKISIVTPSFNSADFLEETIRSVLDQNYSNLEYIIIDGGSTDGTIDIIQKYEKELFYWISEPDNGMYDALNKGFSKSTGEIMGWSPASDLYEKNAFWTVADVFSKFPQIEWLTSLYKIRYDEQGKEIARYKINGFNRKAFFRGQNCLGFPGAKYNIQQQSTFWRRSLWHKAGGEMDDRLRSAGDFELWARFYQYADLFAVDQPLGIFRQHKNQVSSADNIEHFREKQKIFRDYGGKLYSPFKLFVGSNSILKKGRNRLKKYFKAGYHAKIIDRDYNNSRWIIKTEVF